MTQDTLLWLRYWFAMQQTGKVEQDLSKLSETDYLTAGYIDSQGVIQLIVDIEARFDVTFSLEAYQDPKFATVGGLAGMIDALRSS